ncbi:hypothetical protein FACS189420_8510 [Bacteroidia bacterium]|nr:hypothetical protein FACS189420_8510 [Bacteroidia bacterium]
MRYLLKYSSHINDNSIYYTKGTNFISDPEYVPFVIPEDALMDSVDISVEDIMNVFTRKNPDGSIVVTFLDGSELTLGIENSSVGINIANEFFDGKDINTNKEKSQEKKQHWMQYLELSDLSDFQVWLSALFILQPYLLSLMTHDLQ